MQPNIVDDVRAHFGEGCFACGRANPVGLGIDGFTVEGDEVLATYRPIPDHRGLASRLHGGLVATALDEIMVWAGILIAGVMSVTGTMDLRFRSPAPIDGTLVLAGSVTERRGRRLRLSGELRTDAVHAEASGLYLVTESIEEMLA